MWYISSVVNLGSAPIINEMATVIVNELECEVTYTTMVVGTLDGDLVGPRLSYEAVTTGTCPVNVMGEFYVESVSSHLNKSQLWIGAFD